MASDSIDSNNGGWMVSSLTIEGWLEDAIKKVNRNPQIEVILDAFNLLHVSIQNDDIDQIDIISLEGKIVKHASNTDIIDVSNLTQGLYLVKINKLYTQKIVKK
jgi:hypothetical protein